MNFGASSNSARRRTKNGEAEWSSYRNLKMAIFSRRRLHMMFATLASLMTDAQSKDLLKRLENTDTSSALAAEIELGLLWAISEVADIDLQPKLESKRRPEAFSKSLFRSGSTFIEITAVSDDSFSDRDKMERAANIIAQYADGIRKTAGRHLYFNFLEQSGHKNGKFFRKRSIKSDFFLTIDLKKNSKRLDR